MNNILARPFSWSYSRIKNYETCPRRYNEIDVLHNFKEEKSRELEDGFAVHDAMAKRISRGTPLPQNMPFQRWVDYVLNSPPGSKITTEEKLAMTREFEPCTYFDKKKLVWLRTVADVLIVNGDHAHIVDWKTGKVKPDLEQLILIATCVMAHHPNIRTFKTELVWLAYDTSTVEHFTLPHILSYWESTMVDKVNTLKRAHDENNFPPKRSGLCSRWCVVTTCEHCGV